MTEPTETYYAECAKCGATIRSEGRTATCPRCGTEYEFDWDFAVRAMEGKSA